MTVQVRRWATVASLLMAALISAALPSAIAASSAQVSIVEVDGQRVVDGRVPDAVTGDVTVSGAAMPGAAGPASAPAPLVADAGDSGFIARGGKAVLLGSAYGGTAPYTWAWAAASGTILSPNAASTEFDSADLAVGTYQAALTVTDARGITATDTVKVVVAELSSATLLEQTRTDAAPGLLERDSPVVFPFSVPAGVESFDLTLSWTNTVNDYEIRVADPSGLIVGRSETTGHPEQTSVSLPAPGTWKVIAAKYLTVGDNLTAKVVARQLTGDPRPVVRAGGPYEFELGTPQLLTGTVSGGNGPVLVAWDLDGDGLFDDGTGPSTTASLPEGRHLVTLKATDAAGLERRETTSVLVRVPGRLAAGPAITVIGVTDTGINPYHLEFSARSYPDPDVLALTQNFTRHPSVYIPGYPAAAVAIPVTLGKGYLPPEDSSLWAADRLTSGTMYWIPGTKIVGAYSAAIDGTRPILDDMGHGTGSASVAAGNRYGYCPTCLLVIIEGLDETVATAYPWVDITTHSFGYDGGVPVGPVMSGEEATRAAVERGQTVLFAAGNGVANAFDVPVVTWHSDRTGPDWNITVGALRRNDQRAVVGDGIPVHVSSWGIGSLPSACHTGTYCQHQFDGTSAATPYTAGVFGTTLQEVRDAIGDDRAGQKAGQVVAQGATVPDSVYLSDGKLTRAELREAVLKNAFPLGADNLPQPSRPTGAPYSPANVLFEGYGAATPASAQRAVNVLLGRALMPERPEEDDFFAADRAIRDAIWGGYDRDGDGTAEVAPLPSGLSVHLSDVATPQGALSVLGQVMAAQTDAAGTGQGDRAQTGPLDAPAFTYYLHQPADCREKTMDRTNRVGDASGCQVEDLLSSAAPYLPGPAYPSTDVLAEPLAAGSQAHAEIYLATQAPTLQAPTPVLLATDREIGRGTTTAQPIVGDLLCDTVGQACWTKFTIDFTTDRPAFTGEQLTLQLEFKNTAQTHVGYEDDHVSLVAIAPAALPGTGLDFGVTLTSPTKGDEVVDGSTIVAGGQYAFPDPGTDPAGVGGHPETYRVQVSVDDPSFGIPLPATLDGTSDTWQVSVGRLALGEHRLYARAMRDGTPSVVVASTFLVVPDAHIEWQLVDRNSPVDPAQWRSATGLADWSFAFDTSDYDAGRKRLVVRLIERGVETARDNVRVRLG